MTTGDDLRAALTAHTDDAPAAPDRLEEVRHRILAARRRRRAAVTGAVVVVAVAVVVPIAATRHAGSDRAADPAAAGSASFRPGPSAQPVSPPAPTLPPPTRPVTGPWPSYSGGGIALGGVRFRSTTRDGSASFTITPTSPFLALVTQCSAAGAQAAFVGFAFDGRTAAPLSGCGITQGAAYGSGSGFAVTPGRPTRVTVTLDPGGGAVGTVTAVVYQAIPFGSYPLPPRPARLASLDANLAPDHLSALLDSRTVGADGVRSVRVRAEPGTTVSITLIGPGIVQASVGGSRLEAAGYSWSSEQFGSIDLSPSTLHVPAGAAVTLRVTASHFSGPYWLVATGRDG